MTKLIHAIGLVFCYVVNVSMRKRILIGAEITMSWDDENETLDYYASFAPDPAGEGEFDEYGVADDEIFFYFKDIKEAIRSLFRNGEGWTSDSVGLVFLD